MKENTQKRLIKTTIKTIIACQGLIAVGVFSHHLSGNQVKAFAAENKINNQQATLKESVQQNQTNSKVQNNINKTTGSLNNVKNKQQTYTNVNATQQKQHIPLTKSDVGTSKQSFLRVMHHKSTLQKYKKALVIYNQQR